MVGSGQIWWFIHIDEGIGQVKIILSSQNVSDFGCYCLLSLVYKLQSNDTRL